MLSRRNVTLAARVLLWAFVSSAMIFGVNYYCEQQEAKIEGPKPDYSEIETPAVFYKPDMIIFIEKGQHLGLTTDFPPQVCYFDEQAAVQPRTHCHDSYPEWEPMR